MKKYIKPNIEEIAIDVAQPIVASDIDGWDERGDGATGQLAPGKKDIIIDDEEDGDYGW